MVDPQLAADQPSGRGLGGKFAPGNSFTRRGVGNQVSRTALTAVQNLSSLAIMKLREQIEAGNMNAIRLALEYTLPRGGRTIEINSDEPTAWADAMASGDISPTEAATAAQALVRLNEAGGIAELTARIAELESLVVVHRGPR